MKIKELISKEAYDQIKVLDITLDHEIRTSTALVIRGNDNFPSYEEIKELEPRYIRLKNSIFCNPLVDDEDDESEEEPLTAITLELRIKDVDINELIRQRDMLKEQISERISLSDLIDILSYVNSNSWNIFHIRFFNIASPKDKNTFFKANYHLYRNMLNSDEFIDNINVRAFKMFVGILEKDTSVVTEFNILKQSGEPEEVQIVVNAENISDVSNFIMSTESFC